MINERFARRSLVLVALLGLALGGTAALAGYHGTAVWIWTAATVSAVIALAVSIVRDLAA